MSKKKVMYSMSANLAAFGVQLCIHMLLTPYITETLGTEAYAFIPLSNSIASYSSIITVAISSMASRFISIEYNRKNSKAANVYFNSALIANVLITALLTIPAILMVVFADGIFEIPQGLEKDVRVTLLFALFGMLISVLFSVYSNVYFVRDCLELKARNEILGNILRSLALLCLFGFFKPKIYYVTGVAFAITILYCTINIVYTKKVLPELSVRIDYFKKKAVVTLISSGIWNSVNQLSSVLLSSLDLFLANVLVGAEASGIYALAKTIPGFLQSLIAVIVVVFIPQFTILYAKEKKEELINSIDFSVKILGGTATLPIAFLLVFGKEFFQIWVPTQNIELLQSLSVLTIIPMVVSGGINTLFNVFTVTNQLKIPSIVSLISGIANTIGTVILLRYTDLGIYAIPLVSCVVLLLKNLTFTPLYAAKCLGERWSTFYKSIFKSVLCTLSMVVICVLYKFFIQTTNWLELFMAAGICSCFALGSNFFLVFDKTERRKMLLLLRWKKGGKGNADN